jgi:hypothetical protein
MIQAQAYVRDEISRAVLSTDIAALNKYKSERALYRKVEVLSKELTMVRETLGRVSARLEKIENN